MKQTRVLMGMPITIQIAELNGGPKPTEAIFDRVFQYFDHIDQKFSTYKKTSEISAINRGELKEKDWSEEMQLMFALCEETKNQTGGYFDIRTPKGMYDPSGIVKGWSIWQAAQL